MICRLFLHLKKLFLFILCLSFTLIYINQPLLAADSKSSIRNLDLSSHLFYTTPEADQSEYDTTNDTPAISDYTTVSLDDGATTEISKYSSIDTIHLSLLQVTNTVALELTNNQLTSLKTHKAKLEIKTLYSTLTIPCEDIVAAKFTKPLFQNSPDNTDNTDNYDSSTTINSPSDINVADITIDIVFAKPSLAQMASVKKYIQDHNYQLINQPQLVSIEGHYNDLKVPNDKYYYNGTLLTFPVAANKYQWHNIVGRILRNDETFVSVTNSLEKNIFVNSEYLVSGIYFYVTANDKFKDIKNNWAEAEINYLASKSIISGITKNYFYPKRKVSRAQFASMLYKALKMKTAPKKSNFRDVPARSWYGTVVNSAVANGIITGYNRKVFRPKQEITREQMIVSLVRSLRYLNRASAMTGPEIQQQLAKFKDAKKIADWSKYSVALAVKMGLLKGNNGRLNLAQTVTRAECAVAIKRLLDTPSIP